MSRSQVEAELLSFVESADAKVLCLHGSWGTGKTYLWKKILAASQMRAQRPRYAYVSLFGIDSLERLKHAIFENSTPILTPTVGGSWADRGKQIRLGTERAARRAGRVVANMPVIGSYVSGWKDFVGQIADFYFSLVSDTLICIDDLERKSDSFKLKEVMGLLSFLKEERNCKIILIANDAELGSDEADFAKFSEKLIDVSLHFEPTPNESLQIVEHRIGPHWDRFRSNVVTLSIRNVRILQKIIQNIDRAFLRIETDQSVILEAVVDTMTLFTWSMQDRVNAPPISFLIEGYGKLLYSLSTSIPPEEQKWMRVLNGYPYSSADELDLVLLKFLQNGYFDEILLGEALSKMERKARNAKAADQIHAAWNKFHSSFKADEAELITSLTDASVEGAHTLSIGNLNSTVSLLKELGALSEARAVLESYLEAHKGDQKAFDVSDYPFAGEITDAEVRERLHDQLARLAPARTVAGAMEAVAIHQETPADLAFLASVAPDQIASVLRETSGTDLRAMIEGGLRFGALANSTGDQKKVHELLVAALMEIGNESPLNRRRLRKFGISIPTGENELGCTPRSAHDEDDPRS